MNILQEALMRVLVWLRLIPEPDLVVHIVLDHPDVKEMKPKTLYVVSDKGFQKWAYFLCPAKPDEVIQLSLQPNRKPRWQITCDGLARPTITPSVRQLEGSYAHFWVKAGAIHWCADSGSRPSRSFHYQA